MKQNKFLIQIENGKFKEVSKDFKGCIAKHEGKKVLVSVTKPRSIRSVGQNNLMWLWYDIMSESGNDIYYWHNYYKVKFILPNMIKGSGDFSNPDDMNEDQMMYIGSFLTTTKFNTKEMTNYLENVRSDARQKEFHLPLPEDLQFEQYYL